MSLMEANVNPLLRGSRLNADHPKYGVLIPCRLTLCDQFDAKPAEIRQLLRGGLNPQRSAELIDEMRAAGLPL